MEGRGRTYYGHLDPGKFPGLYISECEETPMASSRFPPISQPPLRIKQSGDPGLQPGTLPVLPREGSSGSPIVCPRGLHLFFSIGIEVFDFHNTRIPRDPRDPRVPGFWSPTVTCQTYLRNGTRHGCWCLQSTLCRVLSHQISLSFFFFSIWPGLIQQSPGLQVPRSLLMYFGCRETGLSEEWVAWVLSTAVGWSGSFS